MTKVLYGLEPEAVWRYFEELSQVPRASGNEKGAADYMVAVAERLGLSWDRDELHNVIIRKAASPGREHDTPVILQGHLDMVPEKNKDKTFDFDKDPIQLRIDGDWLKAVDTTLGADNGIALAMALAILESRKISHPPLEVLCTVQEETGLVGASALQPGFVKGKILLNIDSEEEGVMTIGCAGGTDTSGRILVQRTPKSPNTRALLLFVSGLKGGHSGLEIHQQRGNALKVLARTLWRLHHELGIQIETLQGGNKRNAIPREAEALIHLPANRMNQAQVIIQRVHEEIFAEIRIQDPGLKIELLDPEGPAMGSVFTPAFGDWLLRLLYALPHGVLEMSNEIAGLVQTSTNLAVLRMEDPDTLFIQTSQRSSFNSQRQLAAAQVESILALAGMTVTHDNTYPAWTPRTDSPLLKLSQKVWRNMTGRELLVGACHAGLECGIIGEKYPGMDMISFGPDLKDNHTPGERLHIASSTRIFDFVVELLREIR